MLLFENTEKIFYGSIIQSLNRRLILGDTENVEPIILMNTLRKSLGHAQLQHNAGNVSYFNKIKYIESLINELTKQCPNICEYKERYISFEDCPEVIVDP